MSLQRPLKNRFEPPKSVSDRPQNLSRRELFSCQNLIYWILKNDPQNRLKNRFETPKSVQNCFRASKSAQNRFRGSKSAQNLFQAPKFLSKPVSSTRKPFKIFFRQDFTVQSLCDII